MRNGRRLIYIADDESNIRDVVGSFLESEGYEVEAFEDGDLLLSHFLQAPCDLVILDVMMPGSGGFAVCAQLRKISTVPIIMLSARDAEIDYATGINLGSDDYFTKPFSAMSLILRVRAIFRRIDYEKNANFTSESLTFADLELNPGEKTAFSAGQTLELTPNEFALLTYLLENKSLAVSRDHILEKVWGYTSEVETRAADDTVRRLRKKLANGAVTIETVWGFGFKLRCKNDE